MKTVHVVAALIRDGNRIFATNEDMATAKTAGSSQAGK